MRRLVPLLVVLVALVAGALRGASMSHVPGDFLRYHRAGRLVATGRAELLYDEAFLAKQSVYADIRVKPDDLKEDEFKYAPALAVMMAPLGVLQPRTANVLWSAWNAALIAAMFLVLWRWCAAGLSPWWMLVPVVVLLRPIGDNVNLGQLNPSAVVPATIGLWLVSRKKDAAGGALVGFGTVVKFMPGVLAVYLAWKRRWKALAAWIGVVALIGFALPVAVLGPSRAVDVHEKWIDARAHHFTSAASSDLPGYSMKSFVYRVLGDTPYVTGKDVRVVVGTRALAPETLRILVLAIDLTLIAAAMWLTRGPLRETNDPRGPPEAALWMALLPVISPEARFPHFLFLALPLTALAYAFARERRASKRRSAALVLGVLGAVLLNATWEKLFGSSLGLTAEIYCFPGWGALLVCAALVLLMRPAPSARQTAVS